MLASCTDVRVEDQTPFAQGIFGKTTKSVGDFMCCPGTGETFPISVPIHIFPGRFLFPEDGESSLDASDVHEVGFVAHSDDSGAYRAELPPGEYTVFMELDGTLYRNCLTLEDPSTFCTVVVVEDEFSEVNMDDNSDAVY